MSARDPVIRARAWRRIVFSAMAIGISAGVRVFTDAARAHGHNDDGSWYDLPVELQVGDSSSEKTGGQLSEVPIAVPENVAFVVIRVLAAGDACPADASGLPHLRATLDGREVAVFAIDAVRERPAGYSAKPIPIAPGNHRIAVTFADDFFVSPSCDRNAYLRAVYIASSDANDNGRLK